MNRIDKFLLCVALALVTSHVFPQRPINEAQLRGLERTFTAAQTFGNSHPLTFSDTSGAQQINWGCDTITECFLADPVLRFVPEGPDSGDRIYEFQGRAGIASITCVESGGCTMKSASGDFTKLIGREWEAPTITLDGDVTFEHTLTDFSAADPVIRWGVSSAVPKKLVFEGKGNTTAANGVGYEFNNAGTGGTGVLQFSVQDTGIGFTSGVDLSFVVIPGDIQFLSLTGALELQAGAGNAIGLNYLGSNTDTIIQGDTDASLVHIDAGLDFVGIGEAVPVSKLDVNGTITATAFSLLKSGTVTVTEGTPQTVTFTTAFAGTPFCSCTLAPGGTLMTCWQSTVATTTAVSFSVDNGAAGTPALVAHWICTDAGDS